MFHEVSDPPSGPCSYLAADDATRIRLLEQAAEYADLLWAARGGYGATRIVHHITPSAALLGFSDVTALLFAWHANGHTAIHGPVVTQFPRLDSTSRALTAMLLDDGYMPARSYRLYGEEIRVQGPAAAGNLTVLASMCGTEASPDLSGYIVILEDVGEPMYRIDRALVQLIRCSGLDRALAVVLGRFSGLDERDVAALVTSLLPEVPVLYGFPAGHGPENHPVVLGADVHIDGNTLFIPPFSL